VALGLAIYLVFDPFVHGQYMILVLPAAALLLAPMASDKQFNWWMWRAAKIAGVCISLLVISAHKQFNWHFRTTTVNHFACYRAALAIMILTGIELSRRRTGGNIPLDAG
ncbi:MAG: hypothetical protein JO102_02080, partial [Elusimicrobia bacterium]|nr:hypothetical protein [Elusimicrobiota bacterium]